MVDHRWRVEPPLLNLMASRFLGVALMALGMVFVADCFARFALHGLGTPVPVFPTEHLVVTGAYRYVRNRIYVAVIAVSLGEALLFGSRDLLLYGALVWIGFHVFVYFYEEPTLRRTYGEQYEGFCREVPRWIPRLRRAPSSFTAKHC